MCYIQINKTIGGKELKLIALDAGHGLYTAGKRCMKRLDPNETREWFLNQRIAGYAENALSGYACTVIRTDDITGVTDVSLSDRSTKANIAKADAFVSIHHNAGINGGTGGGIEVFSYTNSTPQDIALRKAVYEHTVKATGLKGNRTSPMRTANYAVVRETKVPAVLGEFGYMDSATDIKHILTEEYAKQCGEGIAAALIEFLGIEPKKEEAVINQPSSWAEVSSNKAVSAKVIQGDDKGNYLWKEPVTTERLMVILDRLGLLPDVKEK